MDCVDLSQECEVPRQCEASACRPDLQYHIGVLMEGTLRVASALLDQPMQPPGSTAEGSRGGPQALPESSRQPEHAVTSQADAVALGGASQALIRCVRRQHCLCPRCTGVLFDK